jgi:hypothetical protein
MPLGVPVGFRVDAPDSALEGAPDGAPLGRRPAPPVGMPDGA